MNSPDQTVTISELRDLVCECAESGWDGDAAKPISDVAAMAAENFIRALPDGIPLPEFSPEPDGSISLDWIQSRNRLFSVSVGATQQLACAWLNGAAYGHYVVSFGGANVPPRILDGIKDIMGLK